MQAEPFWDRDEARLALSLGSESALRRDIALFALGGAVSPDDPAWRDAPVLARVRPGRFGGWALAPAPDADRFSLRLGEAADARVVWFESALSGGDMRFLETPDAVFAAAAAAPGPAGAERRGPARLWRGPPAPVFWTRDPEGSDAPWAALVELGEDASEAGLRAAARRLAGVRAVVDGVAAEPALFIAPNGRAYGVFEPPAARAGAVMGLVAAAPGQRFVFGAAGDGAAQLWRRLGAAQTTHADPPPWAPPAPAEPALAHAIARAMRAALADADGEAAARRLDQRIGASDPARWSRHVEALLGEGEDDRDVAAAAPTPPRALPPPSARPPALPPPIPPAAPPADAALLRRLLGAQLVLDPAAEDAETEALLDALRAGGAVEADARLLTERVKAARARWREASAYEPLTASGFESAADALARTRLQGAEPPPEIEHHVLPALLRARRAAAGEEA